MLEQAALLSAYGMGTVFVFLTVLVLATQLMSWALVRWAPPEQRVEDAPTAAPERSLKVTPDSRRRAAIAAAIHHHRTRR